MKTFLHKILVLSIVAIAMVMWAMPVRGQTYEVIYWDNYVSPPTPNVPYCPCDSVKCVPPTGVTGVYWSPALTTHGDTLVLPYGFNGQVECYFNGGNKTLRLRPLTPPVSPNFPPFDTVCGIGTVILDAGNYSSYGFTSYLWNTGATTQTLTVGAGIYWVDITNVCGNISDVLTIVEYNPNPPNLGPDIAVCQGIPVILDPGTGFDTYAWTGGSTDTSLSVTTSGTYAVQTTDDGCTDNDTVVVTILTPPIPSIENVSTQINPGEPGYGNNVVLWDSLAYPSLDSVKVYVDGILDGTAAYVDGKLILSVSSEQNGHLIRIVGVDTCGNMSPQSPYVKSNHAWASVGVPSGVNVQWDGLEFEAKTDSVEEYHVWKSDSTGIFTMIGSVGGLFTSYTDIVGGGVMYIVGAIVSAKGLQTEYLSNLVDNNIGIAENHIMNFEIFPNPATDIISIQSQEKTLFTTISDLAGRIVLTSSETEINVSTLPSGTYILKVVNIAGSAGYEKLIVY